MPPRPWEPPSFATLLVAVVSDSATCCCLLTSCWRRRCSLICCRDSAWRGPRQTVPAAAAGLKREAETLLGVRYLSGKLQIEAPAERRRRRTNTRRTTRTYKYSAAVAWPFVRPFLSRLRPQLTESPSLVYVFSRRRRIRERRRSTTAKNCRLDFSPSCNRPPAYCARPHAQWQQRRLTSAREIYTSSPSAVGFKICREDEGCCCVSTKKERERKKRRSRAIGTKKAAFFFVSGTDAAAAKGKERESRWRKCFLGGKHPCLSLFLSLPLSLS
jgi:hypothetical protein